MTAQDVLDAVQRLLEEPQFQDVHFRCSDDRVISSNRAFLAARCEYFERLLFGSLKESTEAEIRLHASSAAVRHVLNHLHTGAFASIEQEACWITLMEASSLAQQYILPGMVQHVADRLSADLRPENLGLALSHALKADLQAVIKSIWIALPRLLQRPFALDRSFSADAICFCLQHPAWMAHPSAAGTSSAAATNSTSSNTAPSGSNLQLPSEASGTAINRASSINGASVGSSSVAPQGAEGAAALSRAMYAPGSRTDSSMAQEAQAFGAVLDWMLQEVASCPECLLTRQPICSKDSNTGKAYSSCCTTPRAVVVGPVTFGNHLQSQQYAMSSSSMPRQVAAPAAAGATAAGSSRAGAPTVERSCSLSPPFGEPSGQPLHPAMQSSRQHLHQQQQQQQGTATTPPAGGVQRLSSHSVRSSYESDTTEGEADIRSARWSGEPGSYTSPAAASAFAATTAPAGGFEVAADAGNSSAEAATVPAPVPIPVSPVPTAPGDAACEQQQQQEVGYSGCCCVGHQGMLLQMLAHLNWNLLEPRLLDKLDSLALLGPAALLEIFRAHQRCCHMGQWGNFPSMALGGERGLRCYMTGGEQVLECESLSHLTATSNLCFTSGKHCWQFVIAVPCDLVWLGLSDGSLQPDVWGGKQPGGWFYGSNDALCHNKQSDRHAYTKHCGNGKWGDGAVIDVCLDMDAREVWFGVDGAEPKLGFTGLPDKVYPAVSLRAPAQLLVRFRAASWLMSE